MQCIKCMGKCVDAQSPDIHSSSSNRLLFAPQVIIAIAVSWILCAILTETNVFSEASKARTDTRSGVLSESPWFRVPYPGIT